jgi:hypothetical protein
VYLRLKHLGGFFSGDSPSIAQHFFYNPRVRRVFTEKSERAPRAWSARRLVARQQLVSRALECRDVTLGSFELLAHHFGMPLRLLGNVAILDCITSE